jgi:hypothetical protein
MFFGLGTLHGCCVVCVVAAILLSPLLLLLAAVVLRLSSDVANGGCGAVVKCVIPQSVPRHSHYASCNVVKMASPLLVCRLPWRAMLRSKLLVSPQHFTNCMSEHGYKFRFLAHDKHLPRKNILWLLCRILCVIISTL